MLQIYALSKMRRFWGSEVLLIGPRSLKGRLEGFTVGVRSVFGGVGVNDLEQAQRPLCFSLVRLALVPAGLYPVVVGAMGRGVNDGPSCSVLVSFNTFLGVLLHRGGSAWICGMFWMLD